MIINMTFIDLKFERIQERLMQIGTFKVAYRVDKYGGTFYTVPSGKVFYLCGLFGNIQSDTRTGYINIKDDTGATKFPFRFTAGPLYVLFDPPVILGSGWKVEGGGDGTYVASCIIWGYEV